MTTRKFTIRRVLAWGFLLSNCLMVVTRAQIYYAEAMSAGAYDLVLVFGQGFFQPMHWKWPCPADGASAIAYLAGFAVGAMCWPLVIWSMFNWIAGVQPDDYRLPPEPYDPSKRPRVSPPPPPKKSEAR